MFLGFNLFLALWSVTNSYGFEGSIDWSQIQKAPLKSRIEVSNRVIQNVIQSAPRDLVDAKSIERLEVLYFLSFTLDRFRDFGIDCINKERTIRQILDSAAADGEDPVKSTSHYRPELERLVRALCDK